MLHRAVTDSGAGLLWAAMGCRLLLASTERLAAGDAQTVSTTGTSFTAVMACLPLAALPSRLPNRLMDFASSLASRRCARSSSGL